MLGKLIKWSLVLDKKTKYSKTLLKKVFKFIQKNKINYKEIEVKGGTWAGRCVIDRNKKSIVINNSIQHNLKPFVILHELGHYYDPEFINYQQVGIVKKKEIEATADLFIYSFCKKHCNLLEKHYLQRTIYIHSKKKIEFNTFEKLILKILIKEST